MNSTAHFKRTIQAYLEQRASEDKLFAVAYRKEGKNIDDCVTYILNEVQRSGCNGFTDGEIYSMAVHYYDEDNIEVGKPISCQVTVNHTVELTEEEKAEARKRAVEPNSARCRNATRSRPPNKKPKSNPHYLNSDYETENTLTERNCTIEQATATNIREAGGIRLSALFQTLWAQECKRHHPLHRMWAFVERGTQPCRCHLRMQVSPLRYGVGDIEHTQAGVQEQRILLHHNDLQAIPSNPLFLRQSPLQDWRESQVLHYRGCATMDCTRRQVRDGCQIAQYVPSLL